MKHYISLLVVAIATFTTLNAQEFRGFEFGNENVHFATSPKNQGSTQCCWDFAGVSFIESELYRTKKQIHDLSEMWIARHAYYEKAMRYVRMHGANQYRSGGMVCDVFNIIDKYGIVPEEVYMGKRYTGNAHQHKELVSGLRAYLENVVKNRNGVLSTAWERGLNAILDAYLGEIPETFIYRGKEYTPKSFAKEIGIRTDDYVCISSYECYPENEWICLEVPNNWAWNRSFNVDFNTYKNILSNVFELGYTACVSADFSNANVKKRPGLVLLHARDNSELRDEDRAKWSSVTSDMKKANMKFSKPTPQRKVTSEKRTDSFLNYFTSDDHSIHLIGTVEDQHGQVYYKTKDSSGSAGKSGVGGFGYMSPAYVEYMSTAIFVNKNSLPGALKKKL